MEKLDIKRVVPCDYDRLYGPLKGVIEYLTEVMDANPLAELEESLIGYEETEMRFVYVSKETDEEYARRLKIEENNRKWKEEKEKKDKERKDAAYKAALRKLNKEFSK